MTIFSKKSFASPLGMIIQGKVSAVLGLLCILWVFRGYISHREGITREKGRGTRTEENEVFLDYYTAICIPNTNLAMLHTVGLPCQPLLLQNLNVPSIHYKTLGIIIPVS